MDSLIRIGTVNDLPQVLNLIKDLAAFENEPYEVEVTIAEMQNWGFGKDKIFDFCASCKFGSHFNDIISITSSFF